MLINEANWLANAVARLSPEELSPCLNIGCQNSEFQEFGAPWIMDKIFAPIRGRGVRIVNTDLQDDKGVDLVGDLLDLEFQKRVLSMGFGSVVCCNVLEHVLDIRGVAEFLAKVPGRNGWLILSCPYQYPYHPDPIDNGFRPTPAELAALFPGFRLDSYEAVVCNTAREDWARSRFGVCGKLARLAFPFVRYAGWQDTARKLRWYNKHFKASCCVMQREK